MADGAAACICILFYGAGDKHLALAQRVLNKPMRLLAERNIEFRFGCNAVGNDTRNFLQTQLSRYYRSAKVVEQIPNIFKYPMMRRMFKFEDISAPITMWFDHDSYIDPDIDVEHWLGRITKQLSGCDMVGSVQKSRLTDAQRDWVMRQPWATHEATTTYVQHAIGSWWAINTDILRQYDWPPTNLQQKDGDVLLGELFKQQNLHLCHFRDGLRINVNEAGVEAVLPRTIV